MATVNVNINVGDACLIKAGQNSNEQRLGTIEYVGYLNDPQKHEQYAGIRLIEPIEGGCQGIIFGVQHFKTLPKHAIFVPITDVIRTLSPFELMKEMESMQKNIASIEKRLDEYYQAVKERDECIEKLKQRIMTMNGIDYHEKESAKYPVLSINEENGSSHTLYETEFVSPDSISYQKQQMYLNNPYKFATQQIEEKKTKKKVSPKRESLREPRMNKTKSLQVQSTSKRRSLSAQLGRAKTAKLGQMQRAKPNYKMNIPMNDFVFLDCDYSDNSTGSSPISPYSYSAQSANVISRKKMINLNHQQPQMMNLNGIPYNAHPYQIMPKQTVVSPGGPLYHYVGGQQQNAPPSAF